MVVHLGGSNVEVVNSQRYRIKQGQNLAVRYVTSATATIRAWARVRYDNGEDDLLIIDDQVLISERNALLTRGSDVARMDGWVTDATVELVGGSVKRGQTYVTLFMEPFGPVLCADYCYSTFGQIALGTYIQSGPGGGSGDIQIITVKADGAPAASTTRTLAGSSAIRKVYGIIWYYNCSADVASRVLTVRWFAPIGATPTGFSSSSVAAVAWQPPSLTLTASEEGTLWADEKRSGTNNGGSIVVDNTTTDPIPFPILVDEADPGALSFAMVDEEVLDRDTIYLVQEEWMVL